MSDHDIYRIIESLDAAQKSVKQLPALFKPAQTSPQLSGTYPGKNATRGYLVGEGEESENPMARAVTRRIVNQHPELLMKYGPREVVQAIDDVTEDDSSDVSAYVEYVKDYLRDHHGSCKEMDSQKPFAEEQIQQINKEKYNQLAQQLNQARQSNQMDRVKELSSQLLDMRGGQGIEIDINGNVKSMSDDEQFNESLRAGEYHLATVTLDDGSTHEVKIQSDEGFREPIESHFKKQGKTVTDIDVDWSVRSDVYESRDTATEDVLSTMKKKLGDYLQDVATAIKKDPDLIDKIPGDVDQIRAVKTIKTDDGHEIKIHGTEDDGFRISIKNKNLKTQFKDLDEAVMAAEMYCARRRQQALEADYIDEKTS